MAKKGLEISARARLNLLLAAVLAVLLVCADQLTKWAAASWLSSPVELMPYLSLKYAQNTGIAWSIQLPFGLLMVLNFLLVGLFIIWAVRNMDFERRLVVSVFALVLAGAAGNMLDRLRFGYVIDFISAGFWPVFNLADAFLSIGIFLILLFYDKINRRKS